MLRTKSVLKIVMSSMSLQIIIVISGLILPRMLITEYGSTVNGLVSTVKQIITYFSVISLGLGTASQVALYKPLADNNINETNSILSATRIFFNKTGYLFGILLIVTAFILPLASQEDISSTTISLIVLISGLGSFTEYIILSKYRILLVADQKNYISSRITAQGVIVNTVLSVILIKLHASILLVVFASTLAYIIRLLVSISYVKKYYPKLNFKVKPNFEAISNRWEVFSYQISSMIINYTPIILIAIFCGFEEVSIYSVYNMVYSSLGMIVSTFSAGFAPVFGNVIAKNDMQIFKKGFATFEFVFRNIAFWTYTCALILILPFISLYINNADGVNYVVPSLGILFSLNGIIKSIRVPSVTIVEATSKFKDNKWPNLIEAILNVILSLILVLRFGVSGILLASCVTSLVRSILYMIYSSKHILFNNYLVPLIKVTLNMTLSFVLYYLMRNIIVANYIEWLVSAAQVAVICFVSFFLLNSVLDYEAMLDVFNRSKMILRNKNI